MQDHQHIWVVTGPAGCGKSTVAAHLSKSLELPFVEGDEFHPPSNIEKMSQGIPLTDDDRWDWLIVLRKQALRVLATGAKGVVVTCSALKRKYRDVMRIAAYGDSGVLVHFIYLQADEELLLTRVKARQGHFMGGSMVHSQFESLEEPGADEKDCLFVSVAGTVLQVQELVQDAVKKALEQIVDATMKDA